MKLLEAIQQAYNEEKGITPTSVQSNIKALLKITDDIVEESNLNLSDEEKQTLIMSLEDQMLSAAKDLDFELAAKLRDKLFEMQDKKPSILPKPQVKIQRKSGRSRKSSRRS